MEEAGTKKEVCRCPWVKSELDADYHDREWGRPSCEDAHLFEMLILEGMQAGLSWSLILKKREHMRTVFDGFDPVKIADWNEHKILELMGDPGVIRNRRKLEAARVNARCFLETQKEFGTFSRYLWSFVDGRPIINHFERMEEVPASTELSDRLSKELKKRGFKFVGTTICYSLMQSVGMVNDHLVGCCKYQECKDATMGKEKQR